MLLFFAGASCGAKKQEIDVKKMASILADMQLVDAYASAVYKHDSVIEKNNMNKNLDTLRKYYSETFATHGITEKQFVDNMKAYSLDAYMWDSLLNLTQQILEKQAPAK